MEDLIAWYQSAPKEIIALAGTILGALITGLVTFTNSLLTAWNAHRLQGQQHQHDERKQRQDHEHDERKRTGQIAYESQRDKDARLMQLRREVFFPALESVAQSLYIIGSAVDINRPDSEIGQAAAAVSTKMAGVQLVGSDETTRACLTFGTAFGLFLHEVTMLRTLTMRFRAAVSDPQAMQQHNAEYLNAVQGLMQRNLPKLQDAQATALIAMRTELGLATDVVAYRDLQSSQRSELFESFERIKRVAVGP
ncbi:hypothetical protein LMG31506_02702 [Cupriavidus yeoncheonensis]|uniref:Uncharacterized protein n=1 Tax=Cupriavidus yeoncheonensis TaxID=1462994 RepID=A0A916IU05_9BURK|nr:hypothetical protein [Cupriavidus yeoncheonensis]CAG2142768.1 hypothetical protein LMG31506_02702 [Cupriavidus yeoncheonensis]